MYETEIITLGTPRTIGELRELIKNYDDNISFGFYQKPTQVLKQVTFDIVNTAVVHVVFSEQWF